MQNPDGKIHKQVIAVALALVLMLIQPSSLLAQEQGMLSTVPAIDFDGSALRLLLNLCEQAKVQIFFDDDIKDREVSVHGKNVSLADICTQVLTKSGYEAATDGDTIFVLSHTFDRTTPEDAVMQMPVIDGKQFSADVVNELRDAQDAFAAQRYDEAKAKMREALSAAYGIEGKEGYVFEIVRRYGDIYAKEGVPPKKAVAEFDQDDFLSRLLLRFMKRKSVSDGDFDQFKQCIALLNAPALGNGAPPAPLRQPAVASADNGASFATKTMPSSSTLPIGLSQQLSILEESILGQGHRHEHDSATVRLNRLEKLMFAMNNGRSDLSIPQRVDELFAAADPSGALFNYAQTAPQQSNGSGSGKNWFTNPPPMAMFNGFGKGLKKMGAGMVRGPIDTAGNVLKSPLFWEVIGVGGAAVGGVFLMRSLYKNGGGGGGVYGGNPYAASGELGCIGETVCNHCKNCRYCQFCNSGAFAKCGVFYSVRGWRTP